MDIKDLTAQMPWQKSVGKRGLKQIKYAVVHHDGERTDNGVYVDIARYKAEASYHISKGWGHLSYHYKINKDGQVFLCVPEIEIGYHAGNWHVNQYGLGICLDGDFSKHDPAYEQIDALEALILYLSTQRPDIPFLTQRSFYAHKEVRLLPTFCPGPKITDLIRNYRQL